MKILLGKILIILTWVAILNSKVQANDLFPVTLKQRTDNSTLVTEGTVVAQKSFWDEQHRNIYTANIIKIYRIFKGEITGGEIEIVTEGGTVDRIKHIFSSTLSLSLNETGIFFCIPHSVKGANMLSQTHASFMVYSSLQGFIVYDKMGGSASDPFNRYLTAENAAMEVKSLTRYEKRVLSNSAVEPRNTMREDITAAMPVISGFSPSSIPAGTGEVLTITGSGFGAVRGTGFVEFRNSNDGGTSLEQPLASDYVSWTDTEIRVKVPSTVLDASGCAGTGVIRVTNSDPNTATSSGILVVPFAYSNINEDGLAAQPDHIIDTSLTGGYIFRMETGFAANTAASASFTRALLNWTCNTGINWTTGTTTTVNMIADDGINIVRFDIATELPVGILGRTTSRYSGCGFVGINPLTWYVTEIDVVFNDVPSATLSWEFGPDLPSPTEVDFESVAVHELGHGHQLSHIVIPGAVMHYSITNGQLSRVLSSADIDGGRFVTAHSLMPNICGPAPMIAGTCVIVPVKLVSFDGSYLPTDHTALLTWKTITESTISGYRIQRSTDGNNFTNLGFVKSIKTGSSNMYTYTDPGLTANKWFYRLAILSADGSEKLSSIILIDAGKTSTGIAVYPNPAKTDIVFSGTNIQLQGSRLEILGTDGRSMMNVLFNEQVNFFSKQISVAQLAPGIYIYKLHTRPGSTYTGKFVKN